MILAPIISLALAVASSDSTPVRPISQLVHTTWTRATGGPIGIRALAQTTDRYIWIGSYFGLFRFDGVRFARYAPLTGDSMPTGPINRLVAGRDGGLWVIGPGGVVIHLRDGHATNYGRPADSVRVVLVAESRAGEVLAAVTTGLFRLTDGKWENVGPGWGYPGKQCYAVWYDRDETLWAVTEDRVVYRPAGASRFVDAGHRTSSVSLGTHFAQERDGTVWTSELNKTAHTLHTDGGDSSAAYTVVDDDPLALLIDRKGSLWIASAGHGLRRVADVARIRGRKIEKYGPELEQYTMKQGALTDLPAALLEDHEGNIWVGSSGGLERFREGAFTPVLTLSPGRPRYVDAGRDSSVWTSPFNEGTLQRFGPHSSDSLFPGTNSTGIAQDSSGGTYVLQGSNIIRIRGQEKEFLRIPLRKGSAKSLFNMTFDPSGTLWAYSQDLGLMRLEGDTMIQVARLENSADRTGMLYSDSKGNIWVAQRNRASLVSGGTVTQYGPDKGVAGLVSGFYEDRSGKVWTFTGQGLGRFEGDRFRVLTARNGIRGTTVFGAVQDGEANWWLSTMTGILRFPAGELERALTDSSFTPEPRAFDESDGMIGQLVKGTWGTTLTRSGDGKIWVATDSGLAFIDPRRLPAVAPPPVNLEVMRIQGREQAIADGAELPPGTSDLEIDYTSLTFATPERVQFRYQLEGADTAWREVGTRRRAYYTELAPGAYRFRVASSYGDTLWNEAGAAWSFRVLPMWYQTLWFRALMVLAVAALGGAAVALMQRGRHHRAQRVLSQQYEATLTERARIAQDLHDTLLQGFAGVTMQLKAAELALPEEPDVAAETLIRVQRLARESLREARERVWEMQDSRLGGGDLRVALEAIARERTTGTGIEVTVVTSGEERRLASPIEDAVFRIGREAIVNAVRHAQPRRIELHLELGATAVRLEVRDDGCGFSAQAGEDARRLGHFGLSGMRDRAQHLGGRCDVVAGAHGGTTVTLELPITPPARRQAGR